MDKEGLRELALFAGAGGGILGGYLLGWHTVCAVEIEDYPRRVLLARQRDGILPRFPIWDDITTFNGNEWRGRVDVVSGGFPCQDISAAGKGAGLAGSRSGLWSEMARVVGEVQPRFVFVENSPMLVSRGLGIVLGDLAALGYDARWGVLGADAVGALHHRARLWLVASAARNTIQSADIPQPEISEAFISEHRGSLDDHIPGASWSPRFSELFEQTNDVAGWVGEASAIGNGQVPAVARLAWRMLTPANKPEKSG